MIVIRKLCMPPNALQMKNRSHTDSKRMDHVAMQILGNVVQHHVIPKPQLWGSIPRRKTPQHQRSHLNGPNATHLTLPSPVTWCTINSHIKHRRHMVPVLGQDRRKPAGAGGVTLFCDHTSLVPSYNQVTIVVLTIGRSPSTIHGLANSSPF
jgi:hypothetical protein